LIFIIAKVYTYQYHICKNILIGKKLSRLYNTSNILKLSSIGKPMKLQCTSHKRNFFRSL